MDWQPPPVPHSSIAADLSEPLDIKIDLSSQITFHPIALIYSLPNMADLLLGEVSSLGVRRNASLAQDLTAGSRPYAIDILQRYLHPFVDRNIHPRYSWHGSPFYPCLCLCLGF
jgi:hypothetical protein